tara:strand:+ start:82641 stop:84473 length:1833 start_codon:yes stop_codon:yes gene_type:complete
MDIEKLTDIQFAQIYDALIKEILKDPIKNFIKAKGFMDFSPTPAQTVALKTIFNQELDPFTQFDVYQEQFTDDGKMDLNTIKMTETELFRYMTGRTYEYGINQEDYIIINMINLVVGRRGGKTTLSAMMAIYCAISTNWKQYLSKTPFATVLVLSHSRDFSDEVLELIRTLIQESPILSRIVNKKKKNTTSTMNLVTPWIVDGKLQKSRVQIKVGAASSKTTRGVAACAVLCDEIAFWNLDENLKETDEKIMKAVRPATKQFGKKAMIIKLSSPGIKQGVLYGEYQKWQEGTLPKNYVVFKAPSWVWNTILPKEEFIIEWELDEDGFDTEYRANFVDSLSNFILPEFIDMAVVKGCQFRAPDKDGTTKYYGAIDAAFKSDRFTFSVVGYDGVRIKQYVSKGWKGSKKEPVKASDVAKYVRQMCREFDIPWVAADQFAFQPLREIFEQYGVILHEHTFTPVFKKKIYFNMKKLVHSQGIDLLDNPIQTKEFKELVVEQSASGNIKIGHPGGGSDDFADSMAIASFLAAEETGQSMNTEIVMPVKDYGIKTDVNGVAFTAPSPEMIAANGDYAEYNNVMDNSSNYVKHPETGRLVRIEEVEDEIDDGVQFSF